MIGFFRGEAAGRDRREFRNEDPPPGKPRPGGYDLAWSRRVVQMGRRDKGGVRRVVVHYYDGRHIFRAEDAHYVLTAVGGLRCDIEE